MQSENDDTSSEADEDHPQISQYAQDVLSHGGGCYGSNSSISYSAINICGKPSKYPTYGDFSECFSLRHYGPPLDDSEFSPKDVPSVTFHDFVVIQFEHFVLPREMRIYETYNPGAVVRIMAYCDVMRKWEILYENQPEMVEKKAREFRPKLRRINVPSRIFRLDFNCSLADYYIGIDAVLLRGLKCSPTLDCPIYVPPRTESKLILGLIQQKLEKVHFQPKIIASDAIESFLRHDLNKFITENADISNSKSIADIPDEVLFNIFNFLDLKSLYNCSKVSRKFHQIAMDPLLYVEVNLKSYWHLANSSLLHSLHSRCKLIRKLDLSSCGYFQSITAEDFIIFIKICGKNLTNLRLNSTQFLNTYCLQTIGFKCENLVELSIRNYSSVTDEREFMSLSLLSKLEVVDLSRSGIDSYALITLIRNNPNLTQLSIAFNNQLNVDQVCLQLAANCPKLILIDLWKCHTLTTNGLRALASCQQLEVIDLGWNLREEANITDTFRSLLQNCQNLRRIVLAAVRGIAERDLENVANFCGRLEHLDLMGIIGMTAEAVLKILRSCERLKVLDLSFCENLDDVTLCRWMNEYGVSIKRSEVPSDY